MAARKQNFTVVGVFENHSQADKAVNELRDAGFSEDQIGVALKNPVGSSTKTIKEEGTEAGEGAITGVIAGLGIGALAGLGVLAGVIPVIGPAIAAGTLGVIVSNAAAGAGIAGLIGALIGAGIPEDEAKYYESEFQAGRTIVTVKANGRSDEALAILRANGAYDMSTRGAVDEVAVVAPVPPVSLDVALAAKGRKTRSVNGVKTHDAHDGAMDTIEVKEERLHAEKHPVQTGEVRVRKEVHTEVKTLEVPVEREEVVIERTPVNRRKTSREMHDDIMAEDLRVGEEIRIPVREEQVNVVKDQVVTEEVKVGKRVVRDTERVAGEVRKEEIKVEESGNPRVRGRSKADSAV